MRFTVSRIFLAVDALRVSDFGLTQSRRRLNWWLPRQCTAAGRLFCPRNSSAI